MLGLRIATAAVLVPLVLAALFLLPPRGWALVTLGVMVLAAHEWAMLAGFTRQRWLLFTGGLFLIGFNLVLGPGNSFDRGWPGILVLAVCSLASAFWILVAPWWLARQWRLDRPVVAALLGWLVLLSTWMALVQLQASSPWLTLAALAVVWMADTAAYFAGRAFGRRKLAPTISPGKTWEGAWGGLACVAVYGCALIPVLGHFGFRGSITLSVAILFVVALVAIGAISIVGDLFESMLKRQRGVKDSGSILPGHGGILDRIDAQLAAMPLAAVLAALLL